MPELFMPVIALSSFLVLSIVAERERQKRLRRQAQLASALQREWRKAAQELGLRFCAIPISIRGERGNVRVELDVVDFTGGDPPLIATRVSARCSQIPSSLYIAPRPPVLEEETFVTGDPFFDERVAVGGDEARVLALLDAPLREEILSAVSLGGTVYSSTVEFVQPGLLAGSREIVALSERAVTLAESLILDTKRTPERLRNNSERDPEPQVRLRNLRALLHGYARSSEAQAAARSSLSDEAPEVRVEAALAVGKDGLELLSKTLGSPAAPPDLRVTAIHRLVAQFTAEEAAPAIAEALAARSTKVRHAAIEVVGRLRLERFVPTLLAMVDRPAENAASARLIAEALGRIGDERGEPGLIALLEREETDVRVAAADALGHVGTIRAIEPLMHCASGMFLDGGLKRSAQESIRRIQSRQNADGGRLSVVDTFSDAGALSVLAGESGALSIEEAPEDPTRAPSTTTP